MEVLSAFYARYIDWCVAFSESKPFWLVSATWMSPIVAVWLAVEFAHPIVSAIIFFAYVAFSVPLMLAQRNLEKDE